MNKMAKGALATGVGVALLLGGGGTLAVWNQTANADAGTIAAGDLNLTVKDDAAVNGWYTAAGVKITNINNYKIVPGETLTYKQLLDITLKGDAMKADLSVKLPETGVFGTNAAWGDVTALNSAQTDLLADNEILASEVKDNKETLTASTTFTFNDVSARTAVNVSQALGNVSFQLTQIAPASK